MEILKVTDLKKTYTSRFGGAQVQALKGVTFSVERGEYVAIMGESGSGKTTLLNLLAALDKPTGGTVELEGKRLDSVKENELAAFRRENLGFVFQEFNLLDTFSLRDNILLPLVLGGTPAAELEERLQPIAESLGIADLLTKYPSEVSGGQTQRAASARAQTQQTPILVFDDSLSAVDTETDAKIRAALEARFGSATILLISHRITTLSKADQILVLDRGRIVEQGDHETLSKAGGIYQKICEIQSASAEEVSA